MPSIASHEEHEPVRAAMAGDRDALRAIWQCHRRWIAAILLAHRPRHIELEDLLQEVAVAMVKKLRDLDDPANLRGWLRAVAINAARAAARPGRNQPMARLADEEGVQTHPAGPLLERDDEARMILSLLDDLPETYREALLLRGIREMSIADIASVLGVTPAVAQNRITRGRRMIRDMIDRPSTARSHTNGQAASSRRPVTGRFSE